MLTDNADVVIVGGAAIGSATAYFLSANPDFNGRIVVLEKDPTYARAASALSTSGVRQQFSSPINVKLSHFSVDFLKDIDLHLGAGGESTGVVFHEYGYLYLGERAAVVGFEANHVLQRSLGVDVALLDKSELAKRFPWLNLDDIEVGSLGLSGEGWTDGYGMTTAFRRRARGNGVAYRQSSAVEIMRNDDQIVGVLCADGTTLATHHVVNASGAEGPALARTAGIDLPIRNIKQMVFAFESPFRPSAMPYLFTPDGLFVRPEGGGYIAGLGISDDAEESSDFDVDFGLFESEIWPRLAVRATGFEEARFRTAWAGHYDLNVFDHNAVVGSVPTCKGLYLANGFSGHGLMHAPAIGNALAELILYGSYRTIDVTDLSIERFARNQPIREGIQY